MGPSVAGILPFAGVDMMVFEELKGVLYDWYDQRSPPPWATLAAGTISSSLAQLVAYPLYLARTRLQADGLSGNRKYRSAPHLFATVMREEGPLGFFKGLSPNLLKLAPAAGISWLVVEETKKLLGVTPSRGI